MLNRNPNVAKVNLFESGQASVSSKVFNLYSQVYYVFHEILNCFVNYLPVVSVRKIWQFVAVINPTSLIKQAGKEPDTRNRKGDIHDYT